MHTLSIAAAILALNVPFTASASPACPSRNIHKFIAAFAEDAVVQRAYSTFPMPYAHVKDDGSAEPRTIRQLVDQVPATYFTALAPSVRKANRTALKLEKKGKARATMTLFTPDTDHQVDYDFRLAGGCWRLVGIADNSL